MVKEAEEDDDAEDHVGVAGGGGRGQGGRGGVGSLSCQTTFVITNHHTNHHTNVESSFITLTKGSGGSEIGGS